MQPIKKPKQKYFSKKVHTSVGTFDSSAEYSYYLKLQQLKRAGIITEIQRQVKYPLEVNGQLITKYIADFVITKNNGTTEVHDAKNPYLLAKGSSTPAGQMFKLKSKLMRAIYGIEIKTELYEKATVENCNTKSKRVKTKS